MTLTLPRVRPAGPARLRTLTLPLSAGPAGLLAGRPDTAPLLVNFLAALQEGYQIAWPVLGIAGGTAVRYTIAPRTAHTTFADLIRTPPHTGGSRTDFPHQPCLAVLLADAANPPTAPDGVVWAVAADGGTLRVHHDHRAVDTPTARRMAEHLLLLLGAAARRPEAPVVSCELLLPAEREALEAYQPPAPRWPDTTVHRMFREQAAHTPGHTALVHGGRSLTYATLDRFSDTLARRLRPAVCVPGDLVVLSGERGLELFAAILGVFKAGAGFVYLDPALPAPRAATMLRQTGPVAVLRTASGHPGTAGPHALSVEALLAHPDEDTEPPDDIAHAGSTAYVIFTSGSTGEPKGVLRPHRMHTSRIFLEQRLYDMGPDDRHLLKSPVSFREFIWPLASGGTAVVVDPGAERDDRALARLIDQEGVTTVSFVPSMLRLLLEQPEFRRASRLRHVFVGGEALGADLEARLRDCGFAVHNTYTLTEADYVSHRQGPVTTQAQGSDGGTVIGRPLDMRVHLCDRHGRRVPPGVIGEIHTGGPGLADGYLGRPDLTADRFVPNTLDADGPPRLFRTGDLARHRPDGQLEYLGRDDAQVKVRGQRVEPAEVEIVLRTHPAVANAAVTGIADPDQGATLVAYVVARDGEPGMRELREFIAGRLPDFMVPGYLTLVPALPLLDSGKVDRAALRVDHRRRPDLAVPYAPAGTARERRITELFARVLGLDTVGLDDDFFALGGDSLRLMLLRGAVEADAGGEVDLADVLRAATPRGVAALLADDGTEPGQSAPPQKAATERRSALLRQRAALRDRRAGAGAEPGAEEAR
ncbi:non-ribosomal peptide synthetase [Streptomyces zagrosensis]|uniref:Amino acid adenylation domain-containing protein n=1 Tax=Streptomyces zagrosensis TaxID=1042984 RepID=A0A7W9QGW2_9ACTN|nr:non-ribosomal peptide synthetase [Streptomyces zagrosensis]MBB5938997.1 amino acid adenylation domain-containing protein [Streptomyces zagrosensis]